MTYAVTTDYRAQMPRTPKNGLPWKLIACHDTEGGTGISGARGTIAFFLSRLDRNASYHELWSYAEGEDAFNVIRIVPPTHCAHSLNPFPPSYRPDAVVRAGLGAGVGDPNQGVYAVSIAGKVADVNRYAGNAKFVAHAKRRIGEIRKEFPSLVGLAEHFRFQPGDRTDWGQLLTPKLGGLAFSATLPDTALEDDMIDPKRHEPVASVMVKGGTVYQDPDRKTGDYGTLKTPVRLKVFALPKVLTDNGKASLVPVVVDMLGGPAQDLKVGWVGYDQLDLTTLQPTGSDCAAEVAQAEQETTAKVNKGWQDWLNKHP